MKNFHYLESCWRKSHKLNSIHVVLSIVFLTVSALIVFPTLASVPQDSVGVEGSSFHVTEKSAVEMFIEDAPLRCFTVINLPSQEVQEVVIYDEMSVYIRENVESIGLTENEFYSTQKYDEYFEKKCLVYVSKDGRVPDHFDALLSMGLTLSQSSIDEILDATHQTRDIGTFLGKINSE